MSEKMFPTLTRNDAIEIQRAWGFNLVNPRKPQLAVLEKYLGLRGTGYVSEAIFKLLNELVEYGNLEAGKGPFDYPECVYKAYMAMFNGFDDFLNDLIGDRFEVESWDDPMGGVVNSVTLYDIQTAKQEYLDWLNDEDFVRCLKVNKNGDVIDVIASTF